MHETEARAWFQLKMIKKLRVSGHCWKMRSEQCARDCNESPIVHIIMQVVGKCKKSRTREFRLENIIGREILYFFHRQRRASVSAVSRLDQGAVDKKCTGLQRELDFHLKMLKH